MTAPCPHCKAPHVEVVEMKSLLLLGEPDEKVPVLAHHVHQGMTCKGSREEVPVPYVPVPVSITEGRAMPTGGGKAAPQAQRRESIYARAARAEKIRKITEAVDAQARMKPHAPTTPQALADWIAGIDMHTWEIFAGQIGVRTPSAETIGAVVAIYRARAMHQAEVEQRQAVAR